jgi:hypothetical protein
MGLFTVVVLNLGVYIWSIVMQNNFRMNNPGKIDWDDSLYARSFLPYFFVQTTGPLSQSYMYWLLSSFATDAQGKPIVSRVHVPNLTLSSERSKRCCVPLSRGYWTSNLVWHEHADQNQSINRNVRDVCAHGTFSIPHVDASQLDARSHSRRRYCRGTRPYGE